MLKYIVVFIFLGINAVCAASPLPQQNISGTLMANRSLSKDTCYIMDGCLFVPSGRSLTIEEGTHIRCAPFASLIVAQGGQLFSNGTPSEPVVFTSLEIPDERNAGDWGGIVLNGNAKNNIQDEGGTVKNVFRCGANQPGGGSTDNDNSGVITYTRIEFAGGAAMGDTYVAGLTLNGIGSATVIEQVQITDCAENGLTILGGTVDIRGLFVLDARKDDVFLNYGYRGNMQSLLLVRNNVNAHHASGSNSILVWNNETDPLHEPFSAPTVSNFTLAGPGFCGATGLHGDFLDGLSFDYNGSGNYYNGVISGFNRYGLYLNHQGSIDKTNVDLLNVSYCSFLNNGGGNYDFNPLLTFATGCDGDMDDWMGNGSSGCVEIDNQFGTFNLGYDADFCEEFCLIEGTPNFILSPGTTQLDDPVYGAWNEFQDFEEFLYRGSIQDEVLFGSWIDICPQSTAYCETPVAVKNSIQPLQISPNPAKNISAISFTSEKQGLIKVVVLDPITGRVLLVREQYAHQSGVHQIDANLKGLKPGVYTIRAEQQGQQWYGKVVVQE